MRKNVSTTQARIGSPIWSTRNPVPLKPFPGQGNRLHQTQNIPSKNHRPQNSPKKNVFLAPKSAAEARVRSLSPHVVDMQMPHHNLKEPWQKTLTDASDAVRQCNTAIVSTSNMLQAKVSESGASGNLPCIFVEPNAKVKTRPKPPLVRKRRRSSSLTGAAEFKREPESIEVQQQADAEVTANADVEAAGKQANENEDFSRNPLTPAPSLQAEYPTHRSSEPNVNELMALNEECNNGESIVTSCELTEATYISFDCDALHEPRADELGLQSNPSGFWNTSQAQFYMPQYMSSGQLGKQQPQQQPNCLSNSYGYPQAKPGNRMSRNGYHCGSNHGTAWKRPMCRQHSRHSYPGQQMHHNSCYSICSHQQQQPQSCGLTDLLAQQLQNQMQQAQVQIAQVQMQLNNVCGAARMQQMQDRTVGPTSNDGESDQETCAGESERAILEPMQSESEEKSKRFPEQFPENAIALSSNAYVRSPNEKQPPMMTLGFYNGLAQATNPPNFQEQQYSRCQLQQHQQQQQQQQQFSGSHHCQPCCRQRYAQMMP